MDDISDRCLRTALNFDRARSQLEPKVSGRAEITRHFLHPVASVAIHPSFLGQRHGCQRDYHDCDAGEFYCLLQCMSSFLLSTSFAVRRSLFAKPWMPRQLANSEQRTTIPNPFPASAPAWPGPAYGSRH